METSKEKYRKRSWFEDQNFSGKVFTTLFALMLTFTAFGALLLVAPVATEGAKEYEMHADEVIMEGWEMTGPMEYSGSTVTLIRAEGAKLRNFVQYYEGNEISSPYGELEHLEMYCTYVKGTGETMGMLSTLEWYGDEEPPFLLDLLPDPVVMTDVTIKIVYQKVESITFEGIDIASSGAPNLIDYTTTETLGDLVLNSFSIQAGPTDMSLAIDLADYPWADPDDPAHLQQAAIMELQGALSGKRHLNQRDVTMKGVKMVIPYEYSGTTIELMIAFDSVYLDASTIIFGPLTDSADFEKPTEGTEGELVEVKLPTLGSFQHGSVEWMFAQNVRLKGLRMDIPSDTQEYGLDTFQIKMGEMDANWHNITYLGYSGNMGKHYMVVEGIGVKSDLTISLPGSENEMIISADSQIVDKVHMLAFVVISDEALLSSQEITEKPHGLIIQGANMGGVTIILVHMHAEGVTLKNMIQEVR